MEGCLQYKGNDGPCFSSFSELVLVLHENNLNCLCRLLLIIKLLKKQRIFIICY